MCKAYNITLFLLNQTKLNLTLSFDTTEIVVNSCWVIIGTSSLFTGVMQGQLGFSEVWASLVTTEKSVIL